MFFFVSLIDTFLRKDFSKISDLKIFLKRKNRDTPTALEIFNFFTTFELKVSRSRRYNSIIQKNRISLVFLVVEYKK